jgi:hypothetical protein
LVISNATFEDNGIYRCHAVNYLGRQQKQVRIVVIKLDFLVRPPDTVRATLSQTIRIDCAVTVSPALEWPQRWSFLVCAELSSRSKVLPNGTLVISRATADDSGLYQCSAQFGGEELVANVLWSIPRGKIVRINCFLTDLVL